MAEEENFEMEGAQPNLKDKDQSFVCPQCNLPFSILDKLDAHLRTHTGENSFECLMCGKFYTTQKSLLKHIKTHSKDDKFICEQCGNSFDGHENLKLHIKCHNDTVNFVCDVCNKAYTHRWSLKRHKLSHLEVRPYQCEHCSVSCVTASHLKQHSRVHSNERPYKCPTCGKGFNQNSSLTKHLRLHTGERPYVCPDCGKTYTENGHLIIHMRKHSGNKPYKCPICARSFYEHGNMKQHMTVHSKEKKYSCNTCGKQFRHNRDLSEHQTVHTKDRPFSCEICGRLFKSRRNINKHKQKQHRNEDDLCLLSSDKSQLTSGKKNQDMTICRLNIDRDKPKQIGVMSATDKTVIASVSNKIKDIVHPQSSSQEHAHLASPAAGLAIQSVPMTTTSSNCQNSVCVPPMSSQSGQPCLLQSIVYSPTEHYQPNMTSQHPTMFDVHNRELGCHFSQSVLHQSNHNSYPPVAQNMPRSSFSTQLDYLNNASLDYSNHGALNYQTACNYQQFHFQHLQANQVTHGIQRPNPAYDLYHWQPLLPSNTSVAAGSSNVYMKNVGTQRTQETVLQNQQAGFCNTLRNVSASYTAKSNLPLDILTSELHHGCNNSTTDNTSVSSDSTIVMSASNPSPSSSPTIEMDDISFIPYDNTNPKPAQIFVLGPNLQCSGCDKVFTKETQEQFVEHVKLHAAVDIGPKSSCTSPFDNSNQLRQNEEFHVQPNTLIKDKDTVNGDSMLEEQQIQIKIAEDSFFCSECQQRFLEAFEFVSHMKSHNLERAALTCSPKKLGKVNNKLESTSANVGLILPADTDILKFHCSYCKRIFHDKHCFEEHVASHKIENPFQCSDCGRMFAKRPYLLQHIKLHIPDKEKNYVCSLCGKCFYDGRLLKTHLRIHTEDKPHGCALCQRRFKVKGDLVRHMRIHTGERPFCCEDCGKVFSLKCTLTRHILLHTGLQPYSCTVCGKTFTQKGNMKQHLQVHRL